jgi:hypothetical protein
MKAKHLVRGKDTVTGAWRVGYLVMIDGKPHIIENRDISEVGHHFQQDGDRPTWVAPKTVGSIAPRQDTDGKNVFEGDVVEYTDEIYSFRIRAFVEYGEFRADNSDGEYAGARVYGWHVSLISATPPEWDKEAELPQWLRVQSLLEIPDFKVVSNEWDMSVNAPVGGMSQNTAEELIERLGKVQRTMQKTAENALRYINNY